MRKLIALTVLVLLSGGIGTSTAQAHLVTKPKDKALSEISRSQKANLAHAKYVCRYGQRSHKKWSCSAFHGWLSREYRESLHRSLMQRVRSDPLVAIRHVFGVYSGQAISVADCETGGTFSVWADNGQYENIFQMGLEERKTYGWHTVGSPAIVAARAAWNYFVASGRDWSPWECKP